MASLNPSVSCEICDRLSAHRHYDRYFVCTPCFIDLLDEANRNQSGQKPYVQSLDRWIFNQSKEKRLIGLSKIRHIYPYHPGIAMTHIKMFKVYVCEEERAVNIYPKVEIVEGNPYYEEAKAYSAVSRTYSRLMNFVDRCRVEREEKGVNLCKLILTFPKELSEYYHERWDSGRPWELFKEFWERLHEEICIADEDRKIRERMGGVVNLHIWSTRKPMEPHYHFHLSFLNIVMRPSSTSKNEGVEFNNGRRFSPVMGDGLLKWVKEKWRKVLEEEGKIVFGADYKLECSDVNYSFVGIEDKKKVLHGLKYQYRQWVVDFCDWSEEERYKGEIPLRMKEYRNRAKVFGFWKKLRGDEKTESEIKEIESGRKKICPFCGSMTEILMELSPDEVVRKLENFKIELCEFSKGKLRRRTPTPELIEILNLVKRDDRKVIPRLC